MELLTVVVGAGPGLGMAVARRFASEGARLVLVSRDPSRLDASGLAGGPPLRVAADVADEASLRAAFARVRAEAGDPQVCVYNASEYVEGAPTQVGYQAFMHGLAVGIGGALVTAQEVAPAMRRAGRGSLLLTGSGVALNPWPPAAGLSVQKAGLRSLAFSLAAELAPEGVHVATVTVVGVVEPGGFFDPDRIASHFWALHAESSLPPDRWRTEVTHRRGA